MSVFFKVGLAALIIFATGSYGLYYIIDKNEEVFNKELTYVPTNSKKLNRKLSINNKENNENETITDLKEFQASLSSIKALDVSLPVPNVEEEDEEEEEGGEEELGEKVIEMTEDDDTEIKRRRLEEQRQLREKFGYPIEQTLKFRVDIPYPTRSNGSSIREREFLFNEVKRDPQFEEWILNKQDEKSVVRELKEHLILASKDHELWDIKHRQLIGYLKKIKQEKTGGTRFGDLTLRTTKEELADLCHKIYLKNPRVVPPFSIALKLDYEAIWNWCTLPQYWAQNKPSIWPQ